jgi:hypothetical protein
MWSCCPDDRGEVAVADRARPGVVRRQRATVTAVTRRRSVLARARAARWVPARIGSPIQTTRVDTPRANPVTVQVGQLPQGGVGPNAPQGVRNPRAPVPVGRTLLVRFILRRLMRRSTTDRRTPVHREPATPHLTVTPEQQRTPALRAPVLRTPYTSALGRVSSRDQCDFLRPARGAPQRGKRHVMSRARSAHRSSPGLSGTVVGASGNSNWRRTLILTVEKVR